MSVRYLLDTNTVSFHIRSSSPQLQRRLRRTPAKTVALSVITEMEIRYGLARFPAITVASAPSWTAKGGRPGRST